MVYKELRDRLKKVSEKILNPIVALLKVLRLSPNAVTWLGFFINIAGAYYIYKGKMVTAAVIILIAGMFDMLDGALARKMKMKSKFGGFLDSTVDRLSEGVVYLGALLYFLYADNEYGVIISFITMFLSFLISYLRARASGLKIDVEIGIATRPERLVILIIGLFAGQLFWTVAIIGALSFITCIQRYVHVLIETKKLK